MLQLYALHNHLLNSLTDIFAYFLRFSTYENIKFFNKKSWFILFLSQIITKFCFSCTISEFLGLLPLFHYLLGKVVKNKPVREAYHLKFSFFFFSRSRSMPWWNIRSAHSLLLLAFCTRKILPPPSSVLVSSQKLHPSLRLIYHKKPFSFIKDEPSNLCPKALQIEYNWTKISTKENQGCWSQIKCQA